MLHWQETIEYFEVKDLCLLCAMLESDYALVFAICWPLSTIAGI